MESEALVHHFPYPQHGEEVSPAASDLAMVLTRGLSLEHQKSSRDSLQYSSGYSTQTTTPSCSEDTIPSQGGPGGIPRVGRASWASQPQDPTHQHSRDEGHTEESPLSRYGVQGPSWPWAHHTLYVSRLRLRLLLCERGRRQRRSPRV